MSIPAWTGLVRDRQARPRDRRSPEVPACGSDNAGILFDHRTDPRIRRVDADAALLRGRGAGAAGAARPHPAVSPVGPASHPPDHARQKARLLDQRDPRNHPDVQGAARRGRSTQADDQAHRGKARGSPAEAPRPRGDAGRTRPGRGDPASSGWWSSASNTLSNRRLAAPRLKSSAAPVSRSPGISCRISPPAPFPRPRSRPSAWQRRR